LALREAAREKTRLAQHGEQFGYRVIADDDLSDSSSSSDSALSSSSTDLAAVNAAAAASSTKRRRQTSSVARARGRKRPAAESPVDRSESGSESGSSSSDSVPYTTLPEESELSAKLRGGNAPLETLRRCGLRRDCKCRLTAKSGQWCLVLLARLAAMSATLDALRVSGVGKQVKRASKAPHAATASRAAQLMDRWAALVRNTLKQSTDVISHTGQLKESGAEVGEKAPSSPPTTTTTTTIETNNKDNN
jgi:hypothetical protein